LLGAQTPASTVAKITNDGLPRDTFLAHTQARINDEMNKYIQAVDAGGAGGIYAGAGVNATNVSALGADGKLFKKLLGTEIPTVDVPKIGFGATVNRVSGDDIARVIHKENIGGGATSTTNRFVAYSNDVSGALEGKPEVKAYDYHVKMKTDAVFGKHPVGHIYEGLAFFEVPVSFTGGLPTDFSLTPESVRLFQPHEAGRGTSAITAFFGTNDIPVKATIAAPVTANHYQITLDYDMKGANFPTFVDGAERNVSVLAKPSKSIVAYFESTAGTVEGVEEAHFTNKIVVQEIGASAKRKATPAEATTSHTGGNISMVWAGTTAAAPTTATTLASTNNLTELGLAANAGVLTTNWVDDRDPAVKVGYDEINQRLTFDASNAQLGLGTGIKKDSFTVYSQVLTDGSINGVGIPSFGNNPDISLATDDLLIGNSFINTGVDVQPANKRYGMDVYFDTVNNVFDFSSGTTGETLAANSALGVTANQSKSDIALGRYKLTIAGLRDTTDDADIVAHKIGQGVNQILGLPRVGEIGYVAGTGLASKPAIATGADALMDMQKAFTLTNVANENRFTVVVDGVSAYLDLPQQNYTGITLAAALQTRINVMEHPFTGAPIGGVTVKYNTVGNNLVFTTGTTGDASTFKIDGAVRFGLDDVALGIGKTAEVKVPSIATDANNRPLYIAPDGVTVTSDISEFENNIVTDFYPLYLDDGELTFLKSGELQSPITKVTYEGLQDDITVDFSNATQFSSAFSAQAVTQDGKGAGQLTNLEIDNILAGYSNGTNVSLGKIILANFSNNAGLKQIGNSTFSATAASGAAQLGEASMDGFGNIMSGSLERSNVDITEELVNLITAQRNYQAAAKAMETTTSMTQTIINIRQ
jgi:flagellar hook protein FlgE